MKENRLAGRFSLVAREDNAVVVGFVGDVTADSLNYKEIRYVAAFYTDGYFLINAANILSENDPISGLRLPRGNFNSLLRICITKIPRNIPLDDYQRMLTEEEDTGIEILRGGTA